MNCLPVARPPRRRRLRRQRHSWPTSRNARSDGAGRHALSAPAVQIRKTFPLRSGARAAVSPRKVLAPARALVPSRGRRPRADSSRRPGARHGRRFRRDQARSSAATIVDVLDHHTLNDFIENPTGEHIVAVDLGAASIRRLIGLDELVLWETADCVRGPAAQRRFTDVMPARRDLLQHPRRRHLDRNAGGVRAPGRLQSGVRFLRHRLFAEVPRIDRRGRRARCARSAAIVRWSILTGGEPLAQARDAALIDALRADGRRVHVESNGTIFDRAARRRVAVRLAERARRSAHGAARQRSQADRRRARSRRASSRSLPRSRRSCCSPKATNPRNVAIALELRESAAEALPPLAANAQVHRCVRDPARRAPSRKSCALLEAARRASKCWSPASGRSKPRSRVARALAQQRYELVVNAGIAGAFEGAQRSATASSYPDEHLRARTREDGTPLALPGRRTHRRHDAAIAIRCWSTARASAGLPHRAAR